MFKKVKLYRESESRGTANSERFLSFFAAPRLFVMLILLKATPHNPSSASFGKIAL
jgi:hypothetical protein